MIQDLRFICCEIHWYPLDINASINGLQVNGGGGGLTASLLKV